MPFLPPNQQRQSTAWTYSTNIRHIVVVRLSSVHALGASSPLDRRPPVGRSVVVICFADVVVADLAAAAAAAAVDRRQTTWQTTGSPGAVAAPRSSKADFVFY